jgi:hypothetical protein
MYFIVSFAGVLTIFYFSHETGPQKLHIANKYPITFTKEISVISPVVLSECKGTDSKYNLLTSQAPSGEGGGKLPFCEILMAVFMKMQVFQHDTVSTGKQLWELRKSNPPSFS